MMMSLTVKHQGKLILSTAIICHIMEETRCDRKIKMILNNGGIENYIKHDISHLGLVNLTEEDWHSMSIPQRLIIEEKLEYRRSMAEKLSTIKLNFYLVMMKQNYKEVTVPMPENYVEKLRSVQRSKRREKAARLNETLSLSASSAHQHKSSMSMKSFGTSRGGEEDMDHDSDHENSLAERNGLKIQQTIDSVFAQVGNEVREQT